MFQMRNGMRVFGTAPRTLCNETTAALPQCGTLLPQVQQLRMVFTRCPLTETISKPVSGD